MLTTEQLERLIKNNNILMTMPEKHYNPHEVKRYIRDMATETLAYKLKLEAYEEIRLARKSGKEPSPETWHKWNSAENYIETSMQNWQPDTNGSTDLFRVSQEIEEHNRKLMEGNKNEN